MNGVLSVGQKLTVVPGVRSTSVARHAVQGESKQTTSSPRLLHTVRRGDTLWRIANLYETSINTLCSLNGISKSSVLYPGAKLTVGYR